MIAKRAPRWSPNMQRHLRLNPLRKDGTSSSHHSSNRRHRPRHKVGGNNKHLRHLNSIGVNRRSSSSHPNHSRGRTGSSPGIPNKAAITRHEEDNRKKGLRLREVHPFHMSHSVVDLPLQAQLLHFRKVFGKVAVVGGDALA